MPKITIDFLMSEFEKKYPLAIQKAYKTFEHNNFESLSMQECLLILFNKLKVSALSEYDAEMLRLFAIWKKDKVDFTINKEILNEVIAYDSIDRYKFLHQPFKCYHVTIDDMDDYSINSFFIITKCHSQLEYNAYDNLNEVFISIPVITQSGKLHCHNLRIDIRIHNKNNIKQALKNEWYKMTSGTPFTNVTPKKTIDSIINAMFLAINIVYHIHELNETSENKTITNHKNVRINKNTSNANTNINYRSFIISSSGINHNIHNGNTVKSHIRRGHWHHYWVGSKKNNTRHLELYWVDETGVNVNNNDLPQTNINI